MDPTPPLIPAACRWPLPPISPAVCSGCIISADCFQCDFDWYQIPAVVWFTDQRLLSRAIGYLRVTTLPLLQLHFDRCDGTEIPHICSIYPCRMCHVRQIKRSEQSRTVLADQYIPGGTCVLQSHSSSVSNFSSSLSFLYFSYSFFYHKGKKKKQALLKWCSP